MDNIDVLNSRSFYYEVRDGQLVEIPIIEYIYIFNQFLKSLIKQKADPKNEYEELKIKIYNNNEEENIVLSDANLQQTITIAHYLQISEDEMLSNPNSITILAKTGDAYMFSVNVLDDDNIEILNSLAALIVEACELSSNDVVHLFIPDWINTKLADAVLEIKVDNNYGPNIQVILPHHQKRQEINKLYFK